MNPLHHKFNEEKGEFELHRDYLFYLNYNDGFTEKLLNISLYVNLAHEFKIIISAFMQNELQFEGQVPEDIIKLYKEFVAHKSLIKGQHFDGNLTVCDAGSYMYLFNSEGKTNILSFSRQDFNDISNYNIEEQLFLNFHKAVSKWAFSFFKD